MARTKTIALSDEEKEQLDRVKSLLFRSDSVPYGEVIAEMCDSTLSGSIEETSGSQSTKEQPTESQSTESEEDSSESKSTGSRYEDSDFIQFIKENDRPTNGEISEGLGCSNPTVRNRLNKLEESGRVESEKDGRSKRWSVVNSD